MWRSISAHKAGATAAQKAFVARSNRRVLGSKENDECGVMNDELRAACLSFIIRHSAFIISTDALVTRDIL
jgi:hypothetical protein